MLEAGFGPVWDGNYRFFVVVTKDRGAVWNGAPPCKSRPSGSIPAPVSSLFADAFESHRLFDTAAWLSWFKAGDF
jgi:hypothetical protein